MTGRRRKRQVNNPGSRSYRTLEPREIAQIEDALSEVQPEGEVCLVVKNGRLQFIEVVRSVPLTREGEA